MKTAPQLEPTTLTDSIPSSRQNVAARGAVTDFAYQQHPAETAKLGKPVSPVVTKNLPELGTFRALSRQVFGPEAGREYIHEAIVFGWLMLVAAWPLTVTLNQLGTMMISPPVWGPW